ncbi:MAG: hypothetical protein DMD26_03435 [Gemmatimonadetes bacterium]|nr:MAG: hypothetical protein DMD26_03435 [Gemmatimonadota bacterium]
MSTLERYSVLGYRQAIHTSFTFFNRRPPREMTFSFELRATEWMTSWGKEVLKSLPHTISTRTHRQFDVNSSRLTTLSTFVHRSYPHKTQQLSRDFPIARRNWFV